jgi:hypothetical protein
MKCHRQAGTFEQPPRLLANLDPPLAAFAVAPLVEQTTADRKRPVHAGSLANLR